MGPNVPSLHPWVAWATRWHVLLLFLHCYLSCFLLTARAQVDKIEDFRGPLVRPTEDGYVSGKLVELPNDDRQVIAYLGIPYAEPPVGSLRFQPPHDMKPWKGVFNATEFGAICYQPKEIRVWDTDEDDSGGKTLKNRKLQFYNMSEDCLTLNVYIPAMAESNQLPVLVFVHGGSYYMNSGRFYPGEKLASLGVIVITFNYRLGPLGFLCTEDSSATGNYGLLDQVHVLKWIQRNIRFFGGDPKKVTLFGNSAGGASVTFHMLSPLTKGLFSSVIAQSGCALAPWALQLQPRHHATKLAKAIGCPTTHTEDLVECLRTFSPTIIVQKALFANGLLISFAPVIDGPFGGEYLPGHPEELVKHGHFQKLPFMTGVTKDEVSIWFQVDGVKMDTTVMRAIVFKYAKELLQYKNVTELNHITLSHAIMVEYFHKRGATSFTGKGDTRSIIDFISDVGIKAPCVRLLQNIVIHSTEPSFMYEFGYFSKDDVKSDGQSWIVVWLHHQINIYPPSIILELKRLEYMQEESTWSPTPEENNPVNFTWLPYTHHHQTHLAIRNSSRMEENYLIESILFWNSFSPILSEYRIEDSKSDCGNERTKWLLWFMTSLVTVLSLTCIMLMIYIMRRRPLHVIKHNTLALENCSAV